MFCAAIAQSARQVHSFHSLASGALSAQITMKAAGMAKMPGETFLTSPSIVGSVTATNRRRWR
jgi:hypothetical protein